MASGAPGVIRLPHSLSHLRSSPSSYCNHVQLTLSFFIFLYRSSNFLIFVIVDEVLVGKAKIRVAYVTWLKPFPSLRVHSTPQLESLKLEGQPQPSVLQHPLIRVRGPGFSSRQWTAADCRVYQHTLSRQTGFSSPAHSVLGKHGKPSCATFSGILCAVPDKPQHALNTVNPWYRGYRLTVARTQPITHGHAKNFSSEKWIERALFIAWFEVLHGFYNGLHHTNSRKQVPLLRLFTDHIIHHGRASWSHKHRCRTSRIRPCC